MDKEMTSLTESNVNDLIPRSSVPIGNQTIGSRWAFKVKSYNLSRHEVSFKVMLNGQEPIAGQL